MIGRALLRAAAVEFGSALEAAIRDAAVDLLGRRDVWVAIAAMSAAVVPYRPNEDDPGTLRPPTHAEIAAEIGRVADALRAESWRAQ